MAARKPVEPGGGQAAFLAPPGGVLSPLDPVLDFSQRHRETADGPDAAAEAIFRAFEPARPVQAGGRLRWPAPMATDALKSIFAVA
ncbi:hypothetical protein V5F53_10305 [Xanthobacter sp. V4C-4]|uniref:hypothetical protein n=1 Tax=Xanthobacter cornucopiae TaxID=3119924 RepID=UPI003728D316